MDTVTDGEIPGEIIHLGIAISWLSVLLAEIEIEIDRDIVHHVHQGMSNTGQQPSKLVQFALWFGWDGKIRKGVLVILNLELPWVIQVRSPCPSLSCCFGVAIFSHPRPSSAVPSWVLSPGMTCRSIPEKTKPTPAAFRAWKICQLLPWT